MPDHGENARIGKIDGKSCCGYRQDSQTTWMDATLFGGTRDRGNDHRLSFMIKRVFDLIMALMLMIFLAFPMCLVAVFIKFVSKGPVIFWTDRVGINNVIFKMAKFRTMKINTPQLATHLMKDPDAWMIPGGDFLRKTSLDELPQLYNVLKGEMSFVGPRPALFNQNDLVALRTLKKLQILIPGITGWAQVNGRDDLPIPVKVSFDEQYLKRRSFRFDIYIIFLTVMKVLKKEGIKH